MYPRFQIGYSFRDETYVEALENFQESLHSLSLVDSECLKQKSLNVKSHNKSKVNKIQKPPKEKITKSQ